MAQLQGLTIEIGANTTSFSKAMKDIDNEARNISKNLKIVDDTLKTNSKSAEAAASKLQLLKDAYKNASLKVETIQSAIEKLNKEFYSNKSSEEYKKQLKSLENQLQTATLEQDRALEKVIAFKDAEEETSESTSRLGDIIKGSLISSAITKGLSTLVNLLKSAVSFAVSAVKNVGSFVKETIELASNMEETKSKVEAVFGEKGREQVSQWAENAAHDFHTTKQVAMETVSSFGNILTNFGMASDAALKYSENLVLVAAAQADFNNLPTKEVLDKIQSALAGNYKGLQALGIVIKEADITERALIDTGKERSDQLTDLEKKEAALSLIVEKSDLAIQKYSENSGSLVSLQGELSAKIEDVKTAMGERFYPIAVKVFQKIVDFTNSQQFTALLDTIFECVDKIAGAVSNLVSSGKLESYIQWLTANLPNLGTKISEVTGKIVDIIDKTWSFVDAVASLWTALSSEDAARSAHEAQLSHSGSAGTWWGAPSNATGGPVSAGRMYRVNDDAGRRNEIFVPSVDGYILNGNQADRIVNNNNSRNVGDVNIYVNSYGMNVAEVADELGAAFSAKMRMSGAML